MAARENFTYQVALIILVFVVLALGGTTYGYFRSAEEAAKETATKTAEVADIRKKYTDRDVEVRCLKYMLGWDTTLSDADYDGLLKGLDTSAEIHKIDEGYKQDMQMYGKGLDKPNYRLVPAELLKVIKAKNDELVVTVEEQKKLQAQLVAAREESKKEVEMAKKGQEEASAELVKRTGDFETERSRLNGEKDKLVTQKDDLASKLNEAVAKAEKDLKKVNDRIETVQKLNQSQRDELARVKEHENFEVPDGRITYVNQRANIVIINLGSADGLRPQISFSVYDRAENSATKAEKKAGIEVIKVLEAHLSEARIVHSETANPVLPGDLIYSPVWKAGQRLRFALTAFMDINGDGANDRDLVRNLILMNNGVIDVEQGDDGKVNDINRMTLQTRYLIEGELPTDKFAVESQLQGRNQMIAKAQELGIERMPVQKLLGYLGWRSEEKTVSLGRGAQTEVKGGSKPAAKSGGAGAGAAGAGGNEGGNEEFRPRQPAASKPDDDPFGS
ncbi:MAG: hypothetical protein U1A77_06515 [Pirellulales bacterium]